MKVQQKKLDWSHWTETSTIIMDVQFNIKRKEEQSRAQTATGIGTSQLVIKKVKLKWFKYM